MASTGSISVHSFAFHWREPGIVLTMHLRNMYSPQNNMTLYISPKEPKFKNYQDKTLKVIFPGCLDFRQVRLFQKSAKWGIVKNARN